MSSHFPAEMMMWWERRQQPDSSVVSLNIHELVELYTWEEYLKDVEKKCVKSSNEREWNVYKVATFITGRVWLSLIIIVVVFVATVYWLSSLSSSVFCSIKKRRKSRAPLPELSRVKWKWVLEVKKIVYAYIYYTTTNKGKQRQSWKLFTAIIYAINSRRLQPQRDDEWRDKTTARFQWSE